MKRQTHHDMVKKDSIAGEERSIPEEIPEKQSNSITPTILYEHEMVRPESQGERILRLGCGCFLMVFTLLAIYILFNILKMSLVELVLMLSVTLIYYILIIRMKIGLFRIILILALLIIFPIIVDLPIARSFVELFFVMSFCFLFPLALLIIGSFKYESKIKLIIAGTELLVHAPDETYPFYSYIGFFSLSFSIREIRKASIKNISDPELKSILSFHSEFKASLLNTKLRWEDHQYQYVFVLSRKDIKNIKFVHIDFQNQKPILIEFDDAQNFLCSLNQRMQEIADKVWFR